MKKLILPTICIMLFALSFVSAQQMEKTYDVEHFDKIIISPHIAVNLVGGDEESVRIDEAGVSDDKINVEVEGSTLRIYLDGAKTVTKSEKVKGENYKMSKSLYNGTQVRATVTYKTLNTLSVRGEERIELQSKIDQREFTMRIYGESQVYLSEVDLDRLKVTIYGESYLEVENGSIAEQRTKEIGIRKVLGASVLNLWQMLSKDFVVLVLISCVIAVPIANYFIGRWLQKYEYSVEISWWVFMVAIVGAIFITLLTVSFQAVKAALANPVKSLRTE